MPDSNGRNDRPGGKPYKSSGGRDGRADGPGRSGKPYGNRPSGDKPYGKKPYGDRPAGDKPYGDKPYGKKPYGDRPVGDRPYGDKPYGKKPYGDRPAGGKPYGDKPYGDRPAGDKPYGDKPYGKRPYGDRPAGDKPYGKKPYGDRPAGDKPYGDKPYGNKPYGDKPYGKKPYGDRPVGDKPYGKKPYGDRPVGDKPYGKKPYGDRPTGDKPYGDKPYGDKPYGKKPYADKDRYPRREERADRREEPETASPVQQGDEQTLPYFLMGRNAVREAIKSGRSIDRILVIPEQDGSLREITALAREHNLVVRNTDRKRLDELCMPFGHGGKPGNHQGIIAMVPDIEYATLEDILALAKERNEPPFLLLLDEINDPHNLGSMLRSAACAGVHGVVLPKRRAASVTAAVAKASAGAVEYVKVAKVVNLSVAIRQLKDAGVWIAGADMGGTAMAQADMTGPLAIVIGNEAEGLSRLVREGCDYLVSIPIRGPMESLNASVAAAVLLFEKNRQDAVKGGK